MTIKQHGGIFGRNPTFNNVSVDGSLTSVGNITSTTGNIVIASGQGIDFSATAGTGTSELFDDYEEGTWTPVPQDSSGNSGSAGSAVGTYTKIGNVVHATVYLDSINTTGLTAGQDFRIYGLPFSAASLPQAQIFTGDARMNDVTFSGNPNLAILDATQTLVLHLIL
jgi:hypothetical protein